MHPHPAQDGTAVAAHTAAVAAVRIAAAGAARTAAAAAARTAAAAAAHTAAGAVHIADGTALSPGIIAADTAVYTPGAAVPALYCS